MGYEALISQEEMLDAARSKYNLRGTLHQNIVQTALYRLIGLFDYILKRLIKPKDNVIIYISIPDYADNAYHVFKHAVENRSGLQHIWLCKRVKEVEKNIFDDFVQICKCDDGNSLVVCEKNSIYGYWQYLRAKTVFHTHGSYPFVRATKRRNEVCLWHGMPVKRIGALNHYSPNPNPTFGSLHIATSVFFKCLIAQAFRVSEDMVFICRQPNCDVFSKNYFMPVDSGVMLKKKYGFHDNSKLVIWLPTYRDEPSLGSASEARNSFLTELSDEVIEAIDSCAREQDALVIIKTHAFDLLNEGSINNPFSNVKIIGAQEWAELNIKLYDLLAVSDGLITDISSVLFDYQVSTRPIALTPINEKSYKRGFLFPIEYLYSSDRYFYINSAKSVIAFFESLSGNVNQVTCRSDISTVFVDSGLNHGSESILSRVGI